jgi:hypothetical protein
MATAIAFVFVDNPETVTGIIGEDSDIRALRCAQLRTDAARLNATHLGDPYANHIAAQLRDFAYLLERAEREGLFGYQPINYGPEATS